MVTDTNLDAVLEGLLEPLTEDRLPAAEALKLLRAPASEARHVVRTMGCACATSRTADSGAINLET